MERRHEYALNEFLEQVAHEGYASVPKWRMILWYGVTNFAVNVRRDLRDRWATLIDELGWGKTPLRIAELNGNIVLIRKFDYFPDDE